MTMFFAVQFRMMAAPDSALPEKPVRPPISMAPSFARIATSSSELSVRWSVLMTQPARPPRSLTPVSFAISPDAVTVPPVAWQFSTSIPSSPPMRTPAHWAKMSLQPVSATIAAPSQFLMSFPLMAPTRPPTIVAAAIRLFSPERSTSSMTVSPGDIASKGTGFKAACHRGIRDLKVRRKCIPGDHAKEPGAIGSGVLDAGKAFIVWPCPLRVPVKAVASLAFSSSSSPGVRVPMGAKFAIPGRSMSAVRTKFSSRFRRMAESCYTVSICQGSPTVPLPPA